MKSPITLRLSYIFQPAPASAARDKRGRGVIPVDTMRRVYYAHAQRSLLFSRSRAARRKTGLEGRKTAFEKRLEGDQ